MTMTLETHKPMTEGPHRRHEPEPSSPSDETSDLEKLAAVLAQTQAYRTMPIFA